MTAHGDRISFWGNEKVLELDSGNSCNIVNILNATKYNKLCYVYFTIIKN